ncbi:dicarboxylate/amino acid:cation symporter [Bernardetia sp.]|uniref:dicarboxylate/amino acid:cation symporter n=1 Tax=Bernardetia sp. TaxID=1937974 RepID=UPI0025C34C19|nr:dicarboxylate/amino acid:cation symporter [Bernardetia sp.]
MKKSFKLALHWQIIIGMILGVVFGIAAVLMGWSGFVNDWVQPWGKIFVNSLKMIAMPLVFISLIQGIASMSDISKLSRLGSRTILIYLITTVVAISIGLVLANVIQPGKAFSEEKRAEFAQKYAEKTASKQKAAKDVKEASPLQPIIDIVPDNVVAAATNNQNMLQVIFFAVLFGVALVMIDFKKGEMIKKGFDALNDLVIKIVEILMLFAPYGVFSLLAFLIVDFAEGDLNKVVELFKVVGIYCLTVVLGLLLMIVFYIVILMIFARYNPLQFFNGIAPAQLLAFSTSSSAATLPVTMERVNKFLGVPKQIVSFVLPVGATVNMDGTSLYQGVAALFIAQAYGMELTLVEQLGIVLTATLASVGAAAVPGAGILMLIIVLQQAKIPSDGINLILGVDRLLDMCRTVVNVTGDASVSILVAKSENERLDGE